MPSAHLHFITYYSNALLSTFPSVCTSVASEHNSWQWAVDVGVLLLLKNYQGRWRRLNWLRSHAPSKHILLQRLVAPFVPTATNTSPNTFQQYVVRPAAPVLLVSSSDRPIRCGRVPRSPNCRLVSSSPVSVQRDVLNMNAGRNRDERRQAFSICQ